MTARFASLALGSVLGLAASVGIAAPLPSAPPAEPRLHLVADSDFSTMKDHYLQKAQTTLDEWKHKLDEGADKAADQTRAATGTAQADLHTAWLKAQAEAQRLSASGADQWDRTKASFERASNDLKDSWNRAYPDRK
jgi:hypothetical protein